MFLENRHTVGIFSSRTPLIGRGFYTGWQAPATTDTVASAELEGENYRRFEVRADGALRWGSGSADLDTSLFRSGADSLATNDDFTARHLGTNGTGGAGYLLLPTQSAPPGGLAGSPKTYARTVDSKEQLAVRFGSQIHTLATEAVPFLSTVGDRGAMANALASSSVVTFSSANDGLFVLVDPRRDLTVSALVWQLVASSGNYDIGVYSLIGTRLWAKGSTAAPVAGTVVESIPLADRPAVVGGSPFLVAISADNTTLSLKGPAGAGLGEMCKLLDNGFATYVVSSAFPLPATVTLGGTAPNRLPAIALRGS